MSAQVFNECKTRNNLNIVRQYLQYGTFPKDCKKVDRRAVRKRSKTFEVIDGQLYYTGGRPKRSTNIHGDEETTKTPENESDHTQILRKCCCTDEEKHEAVMKCHIGDDGTHYGMEKTVERLSSEYYWVGIINLVRKILHKCTDCLSRGVRGPSAAMGHFAKHGSYDNQLGEEQEMTTEMDVLFVSPETTNHFWQKVEIQVFGPYATGRKQVYVAVALDSFSQFPEATVIETISSATLTHFILNLICRYGVMDKVCLQQNRTTKDIYLYINMQDLELASISPTFLSQIANSADERWKRVEKSLDRFVKSYPKMWDKCLEVFLMPLRTSLSPEVDYTPAFVTFGREPRFPDKLSHKEVGSCASEVQLSEDQERQTVELLMAAYGGLRTSAALQSSQVSDLNLDLLPTVKLEALPVSGDDMVTFDDSAIIRISHLPNSKKRGETEEVANKKESAENIVYDGATEDDFEDASDFGDEEDHDATYEPGSNSSVRSKVKTAPTMVTRSSNRKRTLTYKARAELQVKKEEPISQSDDCRVLNTSALPEKRKRGRPPKVRVEGSKASVAVECKESPSDGLINSVEQLDLDTYYLVIKCYKEQGTYPPHVTVDFKRAIRRLGETLALKEGKLYGLVGKATGRLIITKEKARFGLLRKAHVRGEDHVGRVRMLKHLLDMNVFWKGMSLDLDAYIHACPECVCDNPRRNKAAFRASSKLKVLSLGGIYIDDNDFHMSEDEEEENSYSDLIQFLTDGTFPASLAKQQQEQIRHQAKSYCIINGSLYYKPLSKPNAEPRQILLTEKLRQEAIKTAHIEEENHLSQQDTQAKLRRNFFWCGMTYDVLLYMGTCCMADSVAVAPVKHRNPLIQERVEKFCRYFRQGIPECVYSKIVSNSGKENQQTEMTDNSGEPLDDPKNIGRANSKTDKSPQNREEVCVTTEPPASSASKREDETVGKAVAAIVDKMGGLQNKKDKGKDRTEKTQASPASSWNSTAAASAAFSQVSNRKAKTRHKCDHCGRNVKGDVAFKIHLYKHTGIKPFSCNICSKSFSNRKSQRIHMRKHTGIRPYLCNQCGRDFFRSASLRYHLKAHATGRGTPVSCDTCGRTFTTQHRLNRHKEFKHPTMPKVFMCNQCGKMFTAARSLKRHEQTHTGIRKYQCQYCSKSFFRKEYLNSHLTSHAEWNPETEKIKPKKRTPKPQQQQQQQQQKDQVSVTTVIMSTGTDDTAPSNIVHWTDVESQQATSRLSEHTVSSLDSFQTPNHAGAQAITTAHILTHTPTRAAIHLPVGGSVSQHLQAVHHNIHPPHAARIMSVASAHGPVSVTVSADGQPIQLVHSAHGQEILLQHEPVQYEVECLTGDPSALTEADLNAIHMLAQASLTGQSMIH